MRRSTALCFCLVVLGIVNWAWYLASPRGVPTRVLPEPTAPELAGVPQPCLDRALHLLSSSEGVVPRNLESAKARPNDTDLDDRADRTGLADLSDLELDSLRALLALTIHTYESADLNAFLSLRSGDVEFASERFPERAHALQGLVDELKESRGVPSRTSSSAETNSVSGTTLVTALREYWSLYYLRPPVAEFHSDGLRWSMHSELMSSYGLVRWREEYDEFSAVLDGSTLEHKLCIPHRREPKDLVTLDGKLTWIDLCIPFRTRGAGEAGLVIRFVWDSIDSQWFVQRATSVYAKHHDPRLDRGYLIV